MAIRQTKLREKQTLTEQETTDHTNPKRIIRATSVYKAKETNRYLFCLSGFTQCRRLFCSLSSFSLDFIFLSLFTSISSRLLPLRLHSWILPSVLSGTRKSYAVWQDSLPGIYSPQSIVADMLPSNGKDTIYRPSMLSPSTNPNNRLMSIENLEPYTVSWNPYTSIIFPNLVLVLAYDNHAI